MVAAGVVAGAIAGTGGTMISFPDGDDLAMALSEPLQFDPESVGSAIRSFDRVLLVMPGPPGNTGRRGNRKIMSFDVTAYELAEIPLLVPPGVDPQPPAQYLYLWADPDTLGYVERFDTEITILEDLNGDFVVNSTDLAQLLAKFGPVNPPNPNP